MCGRIYEIYTEQELQDRYLRDTEPESLDLQPVYNLCPTQDSPIVRIASGTRRLERMRWQLVPANEPAFHTRLSTINARSETILHSSLYRDLILRQRCIVPISGFFEWKTAGTKYPFRIYFRNDTIMSVAGIWETWHAGTPDERRSFCILTTSANDFMRGIHDRMPVILDRADEEPWLDPEFRVAEQIQPLMRPCPSSWLAAVQVSPLVNSAKNNTTDVLRPFASEANAQRTLSFID